MLQDNYIYFAQQRSSQVIQLSAANVFLGNVLITAHQVMKLSGEKALVLSIYIRGKIDVDVPENKKD